MLDLDPSHQLAPPDPLRRAWTGVATSAVVHLLLIALVLWAERPQRFLLTRATDSLETAQRERKQVQAIYLAPPRPRPLPPTVRQGPAPPHPVTPPAPAETKPPPPPPATTPERTADPASVPDKAEAPAPEATTPAPTPTVQRHIRSLAFHPGEFASPLTRTDPVPEWQRPPDLGSLGAKCTPGPPHVRAPDEPVKYGVVAGRVYRQGSTEPLVGAVLSVMGTPYQTTSDSNGDYVLRFDEDLVANCQVQYVRVAADGFVSQLLVLSTGPAERSDVSLRSRP